ncbi:MAG: Rdx family protein [Chloroflexi bacterium]|nr:Rdx family protein [Chloroflexota bacterium]
MASEFFAEGGKEVAVKITPGTGGIMQVFIDGEKVFDKKEEGNKFPDLPRVKQMRAFIKQKLSSLVAADD